jgi:molybdopterin synthase sulfur carrier subunit
MAVKVRIPAPLQSLTGGAAEVEVEGKTVREVIDALERNYAGIKARLCDENGELRRFVNVFVNDQDIRFLKGLDTELKDNDEVSIIPAIAGGN